MQKDADHILIYVLYCEQILVDVGMPFKHRSINSFSLVEILQSK